jgi:hypothetical protein
MQEAAGPAEVDVKVRPPAAARSRRPSLAALRSGAACLRASSLAPLSFIPCIC